MRYIADFQTDQRIFPTNVVPIGIVTSSDINDPIIITLGIMYLNVFPPFLVTENQPNLQITKIVNVSNTKSTIKT